MDFLSTGLWWAFFIPATASFSVYTLARRNWELGMKRLNVWGSICGGICLVLVILTFVFSGWKGGLAVIIGMTIISLIVVLIVRQIFLKRPDIQGQDITIPNSLEEQVARIEQEDGRIDKTVARSSRQPKIAEVLRTYGKEPEYLKEVRRQLILSYAGTYVAESVIKSPRLLKQYLQMEADNISHEQIAFTMLKSVSK